MFDGARKWRNLASHVGKGGGGGGGEVLIHHTSEKGM